MFDTTYIKAGPSHVSVSVEEKRAPTDESVRLLREMESKAREQVVEALRIESCGVEAVVHRLDVPLDLRSKFAIHYKVNGVKRECYADADWQARPEEHLEAIWKKLASDLAAYLVGGIAKTVIRRY